MKKASLLRLFGLSPFVAAVGDDKAEMTAKGIPEHR